ncbi:hypothetical protein [Sphingopyxis witflariensis]|uniref:Lipoprotein n=1 Tax=Sphingopyxis witflariensis TaxID=173675 RepID=A0A246K6M2_9SPHN|nr:hypothetical protein [Sphingopyxis witflariensis]OWR01458.1 hypothetical protein CDQ91_03445 [Sphingopyxis witflariensis]
MTRSGNAGVRGAVLLALLLAGCGEAQKPDTPVAANAKSASAAASDGRIACALEGAKTYDRSCTIEEMASADGDVLVVGRGDVGFRRLLIAADGRGLVSADGAEPAKVTIVGDGLIEVAVAGDRYRLPANTGRAK